MVSNIFIQQTDTDCTDQFHYFISPGFSCYKDYTTTNMSRFAAQFAEYGRERYGDSQSCQADIIGHSAILVTADG